MPGLLPCALPWEEEAVPGLLRAALRLSPAALRRLTSASSSSMDALLPAYAIDHAHTCLLLAQKTDAFTLAHAMNVTPTYFCHMQSLL